MRQVNSGNSLRSSGARAFDLHQVGSSTQIESAGLEPPGGRKFDYYNSARTDVADLIPQEVESVLEVGCAAGRTGELLAKRGIRKLIGVEIDPRLSHLASAHYSQVLIGDAEEMDLAQIPNASVDCILYPDVLEHFRDPWATLKRHLRVLRSGGYVVASIPNVRYYKTVRELVLKGSWDYQEAGILDIGHLRFFTWKSIMDLFSTNGLEIIRLEKNVRGNHFLRFMNKITLNRLHHFLVKQYLALGRKA